MWPTSIWKKYQQAREQKRLLREKHAWLQVEELRLSLEWNSLLTAVDHSIVFSSDSEVGLSKQVREFMRASTGNGRLGSIYSIKQKGRSILSGVHNLFLSYTQLELMTGISIHQYHEIIRKYDDITEQLMQVEEQLNKKNTLFSKLFN